MHKWFPLSSSLGTKTSVYSALSRPDCWQPDLIIAVARNMHFRLLLLQEYQWMGIPQNPDFRLKAYKPCGYSFVMSMSLKNCSFWIRLSSSGKDFCWITESRRWQEQTVTNERILKYRNGICSLWVKQFLQWQLWEESTARVQDT